MASIKKALIEPALMKQEDTKESSEWNALMKQREEAHRQHVKASIIEEQQAPEVAREQHGDTLEDMEAKIKALRKAEGQEDEDEGREEHRHQALPEKEDAEKSDRGSEDDVLPEALQQALKHHNYE